MRNGHNATFDRRAICSATHSQVAARSLRLITEWPAPASRSPAVMQLVFQRFQPKVNDIMYHDHAFSFEVRKVVGLGTALHEAARCGRPKTIVWLVYHGADIAALDTCGRTPLEVAKTYGNFLAINCLENSMQSPSKASDSLLQPLSFIFRTDTYIRYRE